MSINKALFEVQKEMEPIIKSAKNPFFKSKYADINSIIRQVLPMLNDHGILLTQPLARAQFVDSICVKTILTHVESGETVEGESEVRMNKVDPQQAGSTITYLRRYGLQSILGLEAVDDDAESAMRRPHKEPEMVKDFLNGNGNGHVDRAKAWINKFGVTPKDIKEISRKYFGSDSVKNLTMIQMNKLEEMIKAKH